MRISLFSILDRSLEGESRSPADLYRDTIEQAVLAEELGYHAFWLAEHHLSHIGVPKEPRHSTGSFEISEILRIVATATSARLGSWTQHAVLEPTSSFYGWDSARCEPREFTRRCDAQPRRGGRRRSPPREGKPLRH